MYILEKEDKSQISILSFYLKNLEKKENKPKESRRKEKHEMELVF
jgi:hypothetical protein